MNECVVDKKIYHCSYLDVDCVPLTLEGGEHYEKWIIMLVKVGSNKPSIFF